MTPPKPAADMAGWGDPAPEKRDTFTIPSAEWDALMDALRRYGSPYLMPRRSRPSLLRRFMRWVWRRG